MLCEDKHRKSSEEKRKKRFLQPIAINSFEIGLAASWAAKPVMRHCNNKWRCYLISRKSSEVVVISNKSVERLEGNTEIMIKARQK